jgi:hypothetical protein
LLTIFNISCRTGGKTTTTRPNDTVASVSLFKDKGQLKETFNEEDMPVNEYLTGQLRPIRENFKRINSISHWTSIRTKQLSRSTEGGEVRFYYQNGQLTKIAARHFGETGQDLTEYYLLNGQLSFVLEKSLQYNRPIYWDSTATKGMNDDSIFDFNKTEVVEDRSYFQNGKLLHYTNSQDCGSPFASDYLLEEQKQILADFNRLTRLANSK